MSSFSPPVLLRSPHLQTILASAGLRAYLLRLRRRVLRATESHVLDCGDGVRLGGYFTPAPGPDPPRGLVVMLHGWEGSADSGYLVSAASWLNRAGYDLFRLNFRDHGRTHELNAELFHSCRLREVVGAVGAIAGRFAARPLAIVGFSLGGNFALRVALEAPASALPLERVVAVCPVIDPARTLVTMERAPQIYQSYFVRKWRESLRIKQRIFPDRYDFREWFELDNLREQTRHLIERYTEFESLEAYLDGYSIAGERLAGLSVQATVIAAEDDPILPVDSFRQLQTSEACTLELQRYGGHCGFIDGPLLTSWVDPRVGRALSSL